MLNASYRALFEEEEEEDKQALQQALEYRRRRERQQPRRQVADKDLEAYRCNPEDDEDKDIEYNEIIIRGLEEPVEGDTIILSSTGGQSTTPPPLPIYQ
jgi:hypothetical protein